MRLRGLMEPLISSEEFIELESYIKGDKHPIEIEGLSESGKSYVINGIYEVSDKPVVIITNSDMEAKNLYEDLNLYLSNVYYFPAKEIVFYNVDAISGDLRWARLKVIKEILNNKDKKIIVTSVDAITALYTPRQKYLNYSITIKNGDEVDLKDISKKLIECGYERVEVVEGKGEFSFRGGILDVFPPTAVYPYRIELFGDEIDSIRTFNIESQRSIEKVKSIEIFPAKEVIVDEEAKKSANDKMISELDSIIEKSNNKNNDQVDKIKRIINKNLEMLNETSTFETVDSYLPFFYEDMESLFDYLDGYTFIIDDLKRCEGKIQSIYYEFNENYLAFLQRGDILPSQNKLLIDKEELFIKLERTDVITLSPFDSKSDILFPITSIELNQITSNSYNGQLDLLIEDIKTRKSKGFRTLILAGTRTRGERLVKTLRERDVESVYKDQVDNIELGQAVVTFGNLIKGFEYPDLKVCVISDKEVFGEAKKSLPKKTNKKKGVGKITSFAELKPGDYVVHANHGIGVFKGIKQIDIAGNTRDYLDIVYDKGDKLYVPVDQLDLVQKYIGSEGKTPKINKLGSNDWQKAKAKVRKSINEIAEDLVKLYAARATLKGYKYSKDTEWQMQFEDEFPYEETPDQLTSLEEIKHDMESDKPMDRLLCGDVGYGKTEVAIRAAFKAVMDGKQVAFLVPTTILAEQHYKNLKKRFSDFPVKIDMISRFRTAKQQKATLQALKEGNVDILIGTHRLVSKDISFKDLGLLIVDEEQRFGVAQKEKIKSLKKNVDVLTLSATPIPRTLHMSLTGVRDISVIETPPEERYPIQTYVVEQNDQLIRDAILREVGREGQVYFVYNRVQNIDSMANYIRDLVPECKVGIMHGKMTEKELETEMIAFMNKEYDVLVCTTIIETGIDISNVNTMIVHDADKMGLSQLYQLRGRVGRTNRTAYAYLMYRRDKVLNEVSEKRLQTIREFTEFGSGFKIAMRDLEIRGAGNILGKSQHGHMEAVGYDLYCKMLNEAVKKCKGEEVPEEEYETSVEIKVDAFIPVSYIKNEFQKLDIYKRIAELETEDEKTDMIDELVDRFGEPPKSVMNLLNIAILKAKAHEAFIMEVASKKEQLQFAMYPQAKIDVEGIPKLIASMGRKLRFVPGAKPYFVYQYTGNVLSEAEKIVDEIRALSISNKE